MKGLEKKLISISDSSEIIRDASKFFPIDQDNNGKMRLKDISSSLANNHIGISTLGITKDNYLVIWKQNHKNQVVEGQFVSTGSGSCDYADIHFDRNQKMSLPDTIKYAMERELKEENKLGESAEIRETIVLGFFRWLSRCGKPEFVGVSYLNNVLNDLIPNTNEVFHKEQFYFNDNEELVEKIDEIFGSNLPLSVPLQVNLKLLKQYLKKNPTGNM